MNSTKPMVPASKGDTTQLAAIVPTAPQSTMAGPSPATAKPTIAPTIEWVVETGHPLIDATSSHVPAASNAASMPYTNSCGSSCNSSGSIMPLRIVLVTSPPANQAPRNSKTTAIKIACLMVIAFDPTEVPIALATSFAPTPQAIKKPNKQAKIMKISPCWAIISMKGPLSGQSVSADGYPHAQRDQIVRQPIQ